MLGKNGGGGCGLYPTPLCWLSCVSTNGEATQKWLYFPQFCDVAQVVIILKGDLTRFDNRKIES